MLLDAGYRMPATPTNGSDGPQQSSPRLGPLFNTPFGSGGLAHISSAHFLLVQNLGPRLMPQFKGDIGGIIDWPTSEAAFRVERRLTSAAASRGSWPNRPAETLRRPGGLS
jgi:hypothetical protein